MVKKRAVAAMTTTTTTTPVFPFPAAAAETWPPHHFSDYGFDPQLICFSQPPETKRAAARRHQHEQQPPPPLEPARFNLQKPISKKKHQHTPQHHSDKQQRRRWWSSAASAALLFFRRPSSKSSPAARTAGTASSSSSCRTARTAFAPSVPLYFADDGGDDSTPGCACWSPAVRPGHLTAAELGVASFAVPYVSLRNVDLGGAGGVAPSMPIYLVT
uniref:Uncharacterized protein n=1 Tax=Avena sativa TaxID=4498 RepID=A0ACD5U2F5_AVESA